MVHRWLRSALLLLVFTAALGGQGREALIDSVNSIPGWTATGKTSTYDETRIEDFSPKLAPSLRNYGISGVTQQAWQSPFGTVRATLFQFTDASAGYGYFTIRRRAEGNFPSNVAFGTESFQSGNSQYFWQARYVVRLEGDSRAMEALARILTEKILGRSQRPPISSHLPASNLVAGSEEYILDSTDIPKVEGLTPLLLGFDVSAEAAAADYRVNGNNLHLLLVLYPTQQIAKKYQDQISASSPALAASLKRYGPLLAFASGSSDALVIQSLLDQVHYASKVTWNEPQPGLGLGPIIVTVFTFIGILLGACIIVGVSLGGFRILMKSLYPNRVFDRPEDAEFIQLKLDQELIRKEIHD